MLTTIRMVKTKFALCPKDFSLNCRLRNFFYYFCTHFSKTNDLVAQLVEQQTLNLWVEGSSPSWVTFILDEKRTYAH